MIATHTGAALPVPSTRLEPRELNAGGRGRIVVTLDIPPGVHIQSHAPSEPFLIPTALQLDATPHLTFGPVSYPPPHTERFEWSPVQLDIYRGTIEIVVPLTIAPTHPDGATTVTGQLDYQACTDSLCLPPAASPIEVALCRFDHERGPRS